MSSFYRNPKRETTARRVARRQDYSGLTLLQ